MLTRFEVQNFRGFEHLAVEPLARVNLIAGKNNIGKTALLEAILLHLGWHNPLLPLRVNALRGVEWLSTQPGEAWGWLFYDRRLTSTIALRSQDDRGQVHKVEIALNWREQTIAAEGVLRDAFGGYLTTTGDVPRELLIRYAAAGGQEHESRARITEEGQFSIRPSDEEPPTTAVYVGTTGRSVRSDVDRFSELERLGKTEEFVDALRILEPRLARVAVLTTGGIPVLHANIGLSEWIPLPLLGEGTTRFATILLAFVAAKEGGVVLIDEIENGLHHSVLQQVFGIVAVAARSYDVQVIATTHSWECVLAAHQAFSSDPMYDFRLHRLERIKGVIRDIVYDAEILGIATKAELEVR